MKILSREFWGTILIFLGVVLFLAVLYDSLRLFFPKSMQDPIAQKITGFVSTLFKRSDASPDAHPPQPKPEDAPRVPQAVPTGLLTEGTQKPGRDVENAARVPQAVPTGLLTEGTQQPGHNVQVWKINPERKKSDEIVLRIAHAAAGPSGGFRMVAFADTDEIGAPAKMIAQSDFLEGRAAGAWSTWTFHAQEKVVFVGNMWSEPTLVYYGAGPWPDDLLENMMYYSNTGDIPTISTPFPITNMLVSFGNASQSK